MSTHISAPLDLETNREKYFEKLDGKLVQRILGGRTHSTIQYKLVSLLKPVADQKHASVLQEWTLAHGDDWMIPDVMLSFPGRVEEDSRGYLIAPALLCIEILSPTDRTADLFRKCFRYHAWGVPYCWIIDPQTQACFEYHGGNDFILADIGGVLTAGDIRLPVNEIFAD